MYTADQLRDQVREIAKAIRGCPLPQNFSKMFIFNEDYIPISCCAMGAVCLSLNHESLMAGKGYLPNWINRINRCNAYPVLYYHLSSMVAFVMNFPAPTLNDCILQWNDIDRLTFEEIADKLDYIADHYPFRDY